MNQSTDNFFNWNIAVPPDENGGTFILERNLAVTLNLYAKADDVIQLNAQSESWLNFIKND